MKIKIVEDRFQLLKGKEFGFGLFHFGIREFFCDIYFNQLVEVEVVEELMQGPDAELFDVT